MAVQNISQGDIYADLDADEIIRLVDGGVTPEMDQRTAAVVEIILMFRQLDDGAFRWALYDAIVAIGEGKLQVANFTTWWEGNIRRYQDAWAQLEREREARAC